MSATTTSDPAKPIFMTQRQLCQRWGVSSTSLRQMRDSGKLKGIRLNASKWRYCIADVLQIEGGEAVPAAAAPASVA